MDGILRAVIRVLSGCLSLPVSDSEIEDEAPTRLERPWLLNPWQGWPGRGTSRGESVAAALARGAVVARITLGDTLWDEFRRQGYLDVRSRHVRGLTYRLRAGRRVQLLWDTPEAARQIPWPYRGYLCINPTYPLPAVEFAAQLYLYLRDREEEVIRVAIPQAADERIRNVF